MLILTLFFMVFSSLHTYLCSDMPKDRGAVLQVDYFADQEEDECDEDEDVLILEEDIEDQCR